MDISQLPKEIRDYLPDGYTPKHNVWLVLPWENGNNNSILTINSWVREGEPYPALLEPVVWFGVDAAGNLLGWDTKQLNALLWNPNDDKPTWRGDVLNLWRLILNGYSNTI